MMLNILNKDEVFINSSMFFGNPLFCVFRFNNFEEAK